mmetsp:Transcript_95846/g.222186  ORF Transcript_95846/g.222186 Transcript_95846/m.222186 type:complete len:255 (+) Transcript_95846:2030-2794(+)
MKQATIGSSVHALLPLALWVRLLRHWQWLDGHLRNRCGRVGHQRQNRRLHEARAPNSLAQSCSERPPGIRSHHALHLCLQLRIVEVQIRASAGVTDQQLRFGFLHLHLRKRSAGAFNVLARREVEHKVKNRKVVFADCHLVLVFNPPGLEFLCLLPEQLFCILALAVLLRNAFGCLDLQLSKSGDLRAKARKICNHLNVGAAVPLPEAHALKDDIIQLFPALEHHVIEYVPRLLQGGFVVQWLCIVLAACSDPH